MPEAINSLHIVFTVLAFGILLGAGIALAHLAITWPAGRVAAGAAVICLLILALAWAL